MTTIRGRVFDEQWVMVRPGETYDQCTFRDCIVQLVGSGMRTVQNSRFEDCTFIGRWPPDFQTDWLGEATRADEPEVIEARVTQSIRPAPRPRRSFFNRWRKRN